MTTSQSISDPWKMVAATMLQSLKNDPSTRSFLLSQLELAGEAHKVVAPIEQKSPAAIDKEPCGLCALLKDIKEGKAISGASCEDGVHVVQPKNTGQTDQKPGALYFTTCDVCRPQISEAKLKPPSDVDELASTTVKEGESADNKPVETSALKPEAESTPTVEKPAASAVEPEKKAEEASPGTAKVEAVEDKTPDKPENTLNSNVSIQVFKLEQVESVQSNLAATKGDSEQISRFKATLKTLTKTKMYRPLIAPGLKWKEDLVLLREQFPNFSKAIDEVLMPSLAIAAAGGIARPAPMLLVGPPGVGKSFFSEMMGDMLGVPRVKVDMASATMGASLGGLCLHWGNSSPGEVFKTLAFGRGGRCAVANPMIFVDEIDKVSPDHRYDPIAPLYALLEVESATHFEDESLPELEMNASHIRWVLCANETTPIPKPILSRVHVLQIPEPTRSERREMFVKIFAGVVKGTGLDAFEKTFPASVIALAETVGPREFKTLSMMAIGSALSADRFSVNDTDFVSVVKTDRPRIGF